MAHHRVECRGPGQLWGLQLFPCSSRGALGAAKAQLPLPWVGGCQEPCAGCQAVLAAGIWLQKAHVCVPAQRPRVVGTGRAVTLGTQNGRVRAGAGRQDRGEVHANQSIAQDRTCARSMWGSATAISTSTSTSTGAKGHGMKEQRKQGLVCTWERNGACGEGGEVCCSVLRFSTVQLDTAAESPSASVLACSWLLRAVRLPVDVSALLSEVSSPWHISAPHLLLCLCLENPFP